MRSHVAQRPMPLASALLACALCALGLLAGGCGEPRSRLAQYSVHVQRGMEAYGRADYRRALYSFEKALEFQPDSPEAHLYVGELYDDYLDDDLEAIKHYRRFMELSTDDALKAKVAKWIEQAEADAAGRPPDRQPVTPTDVEEELRNLRRQHVELLEKYRQLSGRPPASPAAKSRPQMLPWIMAAVLAGACGAILLSVRMGWLAGPRRPAAAAPERPAVDAGLLVGRYFWVENEFNLGTILIDRDGDKLRVESTALSTNARSVGYGTLERDTLETEMTDESGLKAPTVFRFAPDGMSFTAEWTDDLGPGMAIGVRER
jgi:tetratricopeptide (TPR) repeat protein